MPLPEDFRDRPKIQRFFIDLLILFRRRKIKLVCCESYKKVDKMCACKGCPNVYAPTSDSAWKRFLARVGEKKIG